MVYILECYLNLKYLARPLSILFSASLDFGIVSADWKDAGIIPLFKKGKKSDPQNYRPISYNLFSLQNNGVFN